MIRLLKTLTSCHCARYNRTVVTPDLLVLLECNPECTLPLIEKLLIEGLLADPKRAEFSRKMPSVAIAAILTYGHDVQSGLGEERVPTEDHVADRLRKPIRAIVADGLVPAFRAGKVSTDDLARLLVDGDALLYTHLSIWANGGAYWQNRLEQKTPVECVPTALPKPAKLVVAALGLLLIVASGVAAKKLYDRARQAEAELVQARLATRIPQNPAEQFRNGFENARRPILQPSRDRPGHVSLAFPQSVRPPYYAALDVLWGDGSEPEWVFNAQLTLFESIVTHDYARYLPAVGQREFTVTLRYYPTQEAVDRLKVGYTIAEETRLVLTAEGIRAGPIQTADSAVVGILHPSPGQAVSDPFLLEFTLRHPPGAPGTNPARVMHVLVRAFNGGMAFQERYYVVPLYENGYKSLGQERHYELWVPLRATMGLDATQEENERPTRFEVLVVELPFVLEGWPIAQRQMNLDDPDLKASFVRARAIITVIQKTPRD